MKTKIAILSFFVPLCLMANISNSSKKDNSQIESEKQSEQRSYQEQKSLSDTKSKGIEDSEQKAESETISKINSNTKSTTQTRTGSWEVKLNPVPFVFIQLRKSGWPREAFYLNNKDVGTSYTLDDDEEIIDNLKKNYYSNKAQMRGSISRENLKKIADTISLLNYTEKIGTEIIKNLTSKGDTNTADNLEERILMALKKSYNENKYTKTDIYNCRFGGNSDTFTCNDGEYTLQLTQSVPVLLKNGAVVYSAEKLGYNTPLISLSYANSNSEALSMLEQDSKTSSLTKTVRRYTSHLNSIGEQAMAQEIESKFIEKALTKNITNSATAAVEAINSGSPTAVLKIFQ